MKIGQSIIDKLLAYSGSAFIGDGAADAGEDPSLYHLMLPVDFGTHPRSPEITSCDYQAERSQKNSKSLRKETNRHINQSAGKKIFENAIRNEGSDSSWMSSAEAAQFLGISAKSLLNMTSNGKIPYYKLGRRNRYLKADLNKLLLENRRGLVCGN